jgi:RHS repeat-associated protein
VNTYKKQLKNSEQTGLYYYGARYYDARVSQWLSVDPLAEKTMTPYAYCNNNPINMVDPDGRFSTRFGARLNKALNGGRGSDILENANGQFYYTTREDSYCGSEVHYHYGKNGALGKQSSGRRGLLRSLFPGQTSKNETITNKKDLTVNNPLVKLDYTQLETFGDAKMLNTSTNTNFNGFREIEPSTDSQLNLEIVNFNVETSPSSITIGGEVSAFGRLGVGPSINLTNDITNCDLSLNVNGNLNGDDTSTSISVGIKPIGIVTTAVAVRLRRFIPPWVISNTIRTF